MIAVLSILAIACGLALALTPLACRLASRYGLVDRPDGWRKTHPRPTPVAGGPAVLLATAGAVAMALALPGDLRGHLLSSGGWLIGLALAALVICAVGLADDCGRLRGRHKLLGQVVAVIIVMSSGLVVERVRLFHWHLDLGLLAIPFTMFWLLGAINALNLIDGMDGLLTSVGLIICTAIAVMAAYQEQWAGACLAFALAGSLLGFLGYNFPPARIFLGDSGSMLIGLMVGVMALQSSLKAPATIALAAPAALLAIPIFDTTAAILRRKLTGRSIYTTDRGHLHHLLLGRGLSTRAVLLCISGFCLLTVLGALASLAWGNELFAVLTAAAVVGMLVVSRVFGYAEFLLVKKSLTASFGSFLKGHPNGVARQLEVRLQGSVDWTELWAALTACAERLNLKVLHLDVNAPSMQEGYHARWEQADDQEVGLWRAEIPLAMHGQVIGRLVISGLSDVNSVNAKVAVIEDLVQHFEAARVARAAPVPAAPHLNHWPTVPANGTAPPTQPTDQALVS